MRYAIGVDLGGTNIRAALVNEEGVILQVIKEKTTGKTIDCIKKQIIDIISKLDLKDYKIEGIGIGVPGPVKPDGTITRAEMASMIVRMLGINVNDYTYNNEFSDVSPEHWAAKAIKACVDNGLVQEYSYNRFDPELPATRTMISYAIAKVLDVEDVEPIYIRARDTEDSSGRIPVEQMLRLNIIDGYSNGTAKPDKYITRSEAIVIINKYLFRGELLTERNYVKDLRQFTDLHYGHWAYNHIMEATCDHGYVRTYDGNELLVK
jgi:hypothetical protein